MSQNNIMHRALKSILCSILICIGFLVFSESANADSFNKYVGQSFVLPIPKCPVSNGFVNSWSYSCSSTNINITNRGNSSPSEAMITKYFDGTLVIECYFQYMYYINNIPRSGTSTEYHRITCNSNNISISGSKTRLNVGETMQMSYRFSNSTFDATPQITWRCGSNNASVDYRGVVTALRAGQATITASSNLGGNVDSYTIEIAEINPTSVGISPNPASVACDETLRLNATVYPSGASQNVTWTMQDGSSSVASLTSNGTVTGHIPGSITVKATAKNGVYETRIVSVYEPTLSQGSSTPSNNAVNQTVFVTPTVTFSHSINKADNFGQISLKDAAGKVVSGEASISGKSLIFKSNKPLAPLTKYTLTIPKNSVKNKWGTSYSKAVTLTFTTGELEKLTLSISPDIRFVKKGAPFRLTSNESSAAIYYTIDGSQPSNNSTKYNAPVTIQSDIKVRAIAKLEGYADSEILMKDYIISNVAVTNCFPNDENPLYIYNNVIPSITFSNRIEASSNIDKISFNCVGFGELQKDVIVCDSALYIIPKEQLSLGNVYKISIPVNAIKTWQGEYNEAAQWSFATGAFFKHISASGPELCMALKSDNSLYSWGANYLNGSYNDGSYNYRITETPSVLMTDVVGISSGYMHHAAIKSDGSLWMWGRQYCGEFGNGSLTPSTSPVKVLAADVAMVSAGGQATGVIKNDGTLWMSGRNDFGQIGNNSTNVVNKFVQVMTNVKSVSVGWCNTFAITSDDRLYGWGRNDNGQLSGIESSMILEPILLMENVKMASLSSTDSKYFAIVKTDGTLLLRETGKDETQTIDNNVSYVSVGKNYIEYIKEDGSLWAMGLNSYGQLGNGNSEDYSRPVKIIDGVKSVCAASEATFALKENGSVWSWGHNWNGILGQTNLQSEISILPQQVLDGMPMNELTGIIGNKKKLSIPVNSDGIVPVYPNPLTANYNSISWSSSDPNFVTVDERGVIHGESIGQSTITASIKDNKGKIYGVSCIVSVIDPGSGGIDDIYNTDLLIWISDLDVHLKNVPLNMTATLIGINGEIIDSKKSNGVEVLLNAPNTGIYIVQVSNRTYKVLCK